MSTPAAAALSDAGTAPTAAGGAPPSGAPPSGASGAFWDSWATPEQKDVRDWAANKNYADVFTLAKTARGLESEAATLRASKGYPVDKPGADGKPVRDENAWRAWNAAVGVPEKPDQYDIPVPDNNPYPEYKAMIAEEFHKIGVPPAMATAIAKGNEAALQKMEKILQERENTASERGLAELKDSWGANFQERLQMANRGKEWLSKEVGGLNDLQMRTLESVLGTSKFMSAMWKLGAGNGEARFAGGDQPGGGTQFAGGASEAQARMNEIMAQRSGGQINDAQWRELSAKGGEMDRLIDRIAQGHAPA